MNTHSRNRTFTSVLPLAVGLVLINPAWSTPVEVEHIDQEQCDPLIVPTAVDELGPAIAGFPADEQVILDPGNTNFERNCSTLGAETGQHYNIYLINNTGLYHHDVWFVADSPNFWVGNYDGFVNDGPAMRIDSVGANRPLVSESMAADGIFEPGEIWQFRVYHWVGAQQPMFRSVGQVGRVSIDGVGDEAGSNASIISVPWIDEPKPELLARQCFYECKPNALGTRYNEVTSLMIANGNPPSAPFDHSPINWAQLFFLDGNENLIAHTRTDLSARDLDELNVCHTLQYGNVPVPSAGAIQVVVGSLPTAAGAPGGNPKGVQIWMKNVVGRMALDEVEVFAGRNRISGVGKTRCRDIDPSVTVGRELLTDQVLQTTPFVDPVLIEDTADIEPN